MNKYTNNYFNFLIVEKLEDNNIVVSKIEDNSIYAKVDDKDIEIHHERCSCHGGRLTVVCSHVGMCHRFEYPIFDEDKGIVDSDTELEYEIKEEMIPKIKDICRYKYCLRSSEYQEQRNVLDKEINKHSYFKDVESLSKQLTSGADENIFSLLINEVITYYPPNKKMKDTFELVEIKKGNIYCFEEKHWEREKETSDDWKEKLYFNKYHECFMFEKGK